MENKEFTLESWCDDVENIARGVVNPAFLPAERRRCERELAKLTTPQNCIMAAQMIRSALQSLRNLRGQERPAEK